MGRPSFAILALAILVVLIAGCQTTPPKPTSPSGAGASPKAQSQGPTGQAAQSGQLAQPVSEQAQPTAQAGAQSGENAATTQRSAQGRAMSPRRPGIGTAATSQLKRLGSGVSEAVGGLIRRIGALLSIKPGPARRVVAPKPPTAAGEGPGLFSPDVVPTVVVGGVVLAGCLLAAAAIVAGRRRG